MTLETKTAALESTSTTEAGKVSTLESKVATEEAKVVTLETKTAALESTSTTEAGKVSTLESTVAAEEAKVVTLETKTAALDSTSTSEAGKVSTLETTLAAEQAKTITLETTLAAEQAKTTTLETTLAAVKTTLAAEQIKIKAIETTLAKINSKCLDDGSRRLESKPCGIITSTDTSDTGTDNTKVLVQTLTFTGVQASDISSSIKRTNLEMKIANALDVKATRVKIIKIANKKVTRQRRLLTEEKSVEIVYEVELNGEICN